MDILKTRETQLIHSLPWRSDTAFNPDWHSFWRLTRPWTVHLSGCRRYPGEAEPSDAAILRSHQFQPHALSFGPGYVNADLWWVTILFLLVLLNHWKWTVLRKDYENLTKQYPTPTDQSRTDLRFNCCFNSGMYKCTLIHTDSHSTKETEQLIWFDQQNYDLNSLH